MFKYMHIVGIVKDSFAAISALFQKGEGYAITSKS